MNTRMLSGDHFTVGDSGVLFRFRVIDLDNDPTGATATVSLADLLTGAEITSTSTATISDILSRSDADSELTFWSFVVAVDFSSADLSEGRWLRLAVRLAGAEWAASVPPGPGYTICVSPLPTSTP